MVKSNESRRLAVANQPIFETMKTKRGDSVETFIVFGRDESVILNVSFNASAADMMTKRGPDPSLEGFAAKHHQFTIIVIDDGSSIDFIRSCVLGGILQGIHRVGRDRSTGWVDCTNVSIGRPRNVHALSISVVNTSTLYDYLDSLCVSYIDGYNLLQKLILIMMKCEMIHPSTIDRHIDINIFHRCDDYNNNYDKYSNNYGNDDNDDVCCVCCCVSNNVTTKFEKISDKTNGASNLIATDDIPSDNSSSNYVNFDKLCGWIEREAWLRPLLPPLGLCGGGEGALTNSVASGWGSPSTAAATTAPPTSGAAPPVTATPAPAPHTVTWSGSGSGQSRDGKPAGGVPKNQLEQLNTMREALFAQDGWGCQHVNQDTQWDVPTSPEPGAPKAEALPQTAPAPPAVWKASVNNGTDLWEANLRNGGQPPPQPVAKTPWGHTPSTNLGGTWGEDDDAAEGGNVWTGAPAAAPASVPQWGAAAAAAASAPGGGMWQQAQAGCVPKKEAEWSGGGAGGAGAGAGGAWQDPREMRGAPLGAMDPREMRAPSADPRDLRMVDNRMEQIRDMRGDPRGISGRLNGASEMWGQHHAMAAAAAAAAHAQIPLNKIVSQNQSGQWGGGGASVAPPKDLPPSMGKPSGWEEPSPPAQRRAVGNFDDGTSLWGQQSGSRLPGVSHWKEGPDGAGGGGRGGGPLMRPQVGGGGGVTGGPMAGGGGGQRMAKETAGMWRNGAWEEAGTQASQGAGWEEKMAPSGGAWGGGGGGGSTDTWQKGGGAGGGKPGMWPEGEMEWSAKAAGNPSGTGKMTTTQVDILRNSKQLRLLHEMGFKKEDAEVALRMTNMNVDEALEVLNQQRGAVESWRRHEEHGNFDPTYQNRFPGNPSAMQFPAGPSAGAIMNNMAATGGIGAIQPLQVQKYLQSGHGAQPPPGNGATFAQNQPPPQSTGQPSTQQLRMLVQQIQMAVQAGYLNHQILNQPLAPQTLLLLNQLLNNIKQLQLTQSNMSSRGGVNGLQHSVAVTKLKQQISNLQNQITAQQAIYVKQQQSSHSGASGDFVLRSQHDPIATLQGNFSEIALNKQQEQPPYQTTSTQQSRLNQWKLGALEKDGDTDFSRAPGTTSKATLSTTSSTMGSLGLQGDGTWSTGRNVSDGWPDASVIESDASKDWPTGQTSPSAAFTDLVPEFEPGKPWKGTQMKTIEEDPSITPGSVARSPLSITAKESDLFTGSSKTSPTDMQPISLSSSTWSFNPSANQQNFTRSTAKLGTKSNSWSEHMGQPSQTTSELWGVPVSKASRGPPPGLGATKSATGASNGWVPGTLSRGISQPSWPNNWGHSTWLLLKNLTPQIDGSTLRTLCMQHGPLQNFHMYLNHSIALCKYSSREEAHKAQMALNNCVLGNTTICAESPSESEVQNILQHLAVPAAAAAAATQPPSTPASTGATWRPTNQPPAARNSAPNDTWGTGSVWTQGSGGSNLWTPLESGTERGTPSNLNSFLPENLLGGELN